MSAQVRSGLATRLLLLLNRAFRRVQRPQYFQTEAYQEWLAGNAEELYRGFYSRYADFAGRDVLELACGCGGKLASYSRRHPRRICAVDIDAGVLEQARRAALDPAAPVHFQRADARRLPFRDETFDIVISDDGFDHFAEPVSVLEEMRRVLRPGGTAFVSFVPFYSRNCSHMEEYLRVPWHHVLFSPRALRRALEHEARREGRPPEEARSRAEGVFRTYATLSRLTLRGFRRALRRVEGLRLLRLRKQSSDWSRPLLYVAGLDELLVDAIYCVLVKQGSSRIGWASFLAQLPHDLADDARGLVRRLNGRRAA